MQNIIIDENESRIAITVMTDKQVALQTIPLSAKKMAALVPSEPKPSKLKKPKRNSKPRAIKPYQDWVPFKRMLELMKSMGQFTSADLCRTLGWRYTARNRSHCSSMIGKAVRKGFVEPMKGHKRKPIEAHRALKVYSWKE